MRVHLNTVIAAALALLHARAAAGVEMMPTSPYANERVVFWDDFTSLDVANRWKPEITMSGLGAWTFETFTNNRTNVFAQNGILSLKSTLLSDQLTLAQIANGYTHDIHGIDPASACTSDQFWGCMRTSGSGGNVLNPVASGRLRTAETFNFKYGRVEIRARMPKGDWLWPSISLMPRFNAYGNWPASGQIDLVSSRGNGPAYAAGGSDTVTSGLHAGPYAAVDLGSLLQASKKMPLDLADDFHVYGLLWTPTEIVTYIDDPSIEILRVPFDVPMWSRAPFPNTVTNPWAGANNNAAPFDQEFYLVLSLAVGGASGYFPDGVGNKPWTDNGAAINNFWNARGAWYPTWTNGRPSLDVDWVRVYQPEDSASASASGNFLLRTVTAAALAAQVRPQEVANVELVNAGMMSV